MYLKKISTAIKEGNLIKTLLKRDLLFELKRLQNQKYRFTSAALNRHCKKIIKKHFPDHAAFKTLLHEATGDFSAFSDVVMRHQQSSIITSANLYLQQRFDILGSGEITLDPIDWQIDFKSGFKWPSGVFYLDYEQVDINTNADVKIPRELSRCHHFVVLGQAYLLTKEEKYAEEFIKQITSFIDENPLMRSINWGCTMDVAIRAVNWFWALVLFRESPLLTHNILQKIFTSLLGHGIYIYKNPEIANYPENRHNHYVADLAGQIYLGVLFKDIPKAQIWLEEGIRYFFREMRAQILPSGPTYERSTNYHRLVLEMFCSTIVLLDRNGYEIPNDIWHRLEKMFEFVMQYIKPDGMAPIIGDQDNGRFHPFGLQELNDHRYLLAIGAILFNRSDFKRYSSGYNQDCFFLLGAESRDHFDKIPESTLPLESKRFPDAGFFIMRNSDNYMFINNSGMGKYSEIPSGTHTHSDLLSFELAIGGKTFIVDPGTYLYSADPAARKLFRSTPMHNTVVVDNENQNNLKEEGLWGFERNALPRLIAWESTPDQDFFCAEHTGYLRLTEPVLHRRSIIFYKQLCQWEIRDILTGSGEHSFDWYVHFDSMIDFSIEGSTVRTLCSDGINIVISFNSESSFSVIKQTGWVSKSYGQKKKASIMKVSITNTCPLETVMFIRQERH